MTFAAASRSGSAIALGRLARLLEDRTGQCIAPARAWRLETALTPLMRERGMANLDQLVDDLVTSRDPALSEQVVDALLNQETSFFRDGTVLDQVADVAQSFRQAAPHRAIRIWCAGCSTGQEPLSLAMLMEERGLGEDAVEIIATDVSQGAIARCRAGRYSQFEIQRGLPIRRMMTWFDGEGDVWTAKRELLRRIQFRVASVIGSEPVGGVFDIILCRNVMLYLPGQARAAAYANFTAALRPGGLLSLGAGESVIGQTEMFEPSRQWRGLYEIAPAHR
ncbi:CheR family methyltransferase [Sphingomonas sp. RS2018]